MAYGKNHIRMTLSRSRHAEEQKTRLENCKSKEEILKIVVEENIELSDEDLEKISGGGPNGFDPKGGTYL